MIQHLVPRKESEFGEILNIWYSGKKANLEEYSELEAFGWFIEGIYIWYPGQKVHLEEYR